LLGGGKFSKKEMGQGKISNRNATVAKPPMGGGDEFEITWLERKTQGKYCAPHRGSQIGGGHRPPRGNNTLDTRILDDQKRL